jgi:general secretion pathway protein E
MDIAEKRRPQDGRIKTALGEREIELRVSTLPTAFGEKTVIRIFDPDVLLRDFADLGFDDADLGTFQGWVQRPNGMVLITGPTGSGKTTIKQLTTDELNVTTVEDPIEMVTDRFNQVAVQPKIGVDFATTLRSILRQDPDIIMVGEIRDAATAEMAAQAALTGHLVLSTLHTNDSVGTITRLVDLDLPPFLVTSTVIGVMAQRLVRRICTHCTAPAPLSADQLLALGVKPATPEAERFGKTLAGAGCKHCRGTGYLGRVGVFELLSVDAELADRIVAQSPENDLRRFAHGRGMRTLRGCALDRLAAGVTTYQEVARIIGPS